MQSIAPAQYVKVEPPTCPYCGRESKLTYGDEMYPHRPDLQMLAFWNCKFCNAYVGCHKEGSWVGVTASGERQYSDGTLPLGRLADRTLRGLKKATHQAFDPFWKSYALWTKHPAYTKAAKHDTARRKVLYQWLADTLGITYDECHVGMFDEDQCRRVIQLCTQLQAAAKYGLTNSR